MNENECTNLDAVRLKNALLEVLHVASHDGAYSDLEFLNQELIAAGVSEEEVAYNS